MKKIKYFCFLFPLVFSVLNLQGFVVLFISQTIAQVSAYLNMALIILGIVLNIQNSGKTSHTAKLWLLFFGLYYAIGLIATVKTRFDAPIARTMVPIVYYVGFYLFLSVESHRKLFLKFFAVSLVISCFVAILLFMINFDLDHDGIHIYKIDRAGGVYGDANNAALVCILAYLFLNKFFVGNIFIKKVLKTVIISVIFYSLFLTFSTTGLSTFIIVLVISNYKFFDGAKIIFLFVTVILLFFAVLNLQNLTKAMDLSLAQREKIDNLTNVLTLNTDKIDNSGRSELLENLMTFIHKNPILGNGIDFAVTIRGHNTYMGVWADAGILSFVLFIIILFTYILRSFKLEIELRIFNLSVLLALCIFMISLQTVINQPYIIVIFAYLGYLIDFKKKSTQI